MNDESRRTEPKDPRVEAALREFLERVDRGEPVDGEEFLARHALIADQLRSFITAQEDVRKLAETETLPDHAHDSTRSFAAHGQETIVPQSVGKRALEAETGVTGLASQFGRYRIIRALGQGAMGTVYLAEDTHIERQVALKTPHFTEDPTGKQMERFFREARTAGNLRHPNICPIYDFGQIDGKHFITMAYIEGRPLSAFIQPEKPRTERQILIGIRKLALALQAAHDKGIVHRDLKPANIMVDTGGEPIIMDFGLARQASRGDDIRLTQTGNILGTPAFMSPEQVEGDPEKIGPPTDQYSLGVILYELLTGQLPFCGSLMAVMGQILTKDAPRPSQLRPDLDPRIESVCLKMMAKTPSERFPSMTAVAEELATILRNPDRKLKAEDTGGQAARATRQKSEDTGGSADRRTRAARQRSSPAPSPAGDRMPADLGASQALKSVEPKAVTESDLASLEELAREGGAARIGPLRQLKQPWNEGGWIRWSVLAFGLVVFGVMTGVVVNSLGRTGPEQKTSSPTASGKTPLLPLTPAQVETTTATLAPTFKNSLGMEFVLVPKGKSWLGGGGGRPGEKEAVMAHDFYLGKYEVTQEEWKKVTGLTPSWFSRTGGGKDLVQEIADAELNRFPVENVSWDDVQRFLERLNTGEQQAGWVYRLPLVAEWEYACRGGPLSDKRESAYDFYFDKPTNQLLPEQANSNKGLQRTCMVGSYQPNRLGLYDMHGNVWEWCNDPERTVDAASSREPRGGGWSTDPVACKAAWRRGPARWEGRVGFRLARSSGE